MKETLRFTPVPTTGNGRQIYKHRTLGQARAEFPLVHAHTIYDLELTTAACDAVACARQIKQHLEAGHSGEAFQRLRQRETI